MSASAAKTRRITALRDGGNVTAINKAADVTPSVCSSGPELGLGPNPGACHKDEKVFLSLFAYPVVVRQVGDVVNYYFKITNLTAETVAGPIDFYISGNPEPIGTIDELPANGFYDLVITDTIDIIDITKRFVVATVWARLRTTGCQLGNVAETVVSVESMALDPGSLQFANPTLLITATETTLDVQVGVDIINLSVLAVDSLIIDLSVIFGKDTALSYFIDRQPSDLFDVANGVLSLANGQTIAAGQTISLLVTNTDKTINLDGFCEQSCESTAAWRLSGKATNTTVLPWVETPPAGNTFPLGPGTLSPSGICFDGSSIWTCNFYSSNVTKINPSDGSVIGTYPLPAQSNPNGICFEGVTNSIWTANNSNTVSKVDASTGLVIGTYPLPALSFPIGICFDGGSIWATANNAVVKIDVATGAVIRTTVLPSAIGPYGICSDGTYIWTSNFTNVSKVRASDGTFIGTYPLPEGYRFFGICYDGNSIWTPNYPISMPPPAPDNPDSSVSKINASTGAIIGTYPIPDYSDPFAICFDGITSVWTANSGTNAVSKIDASTGAVIRTDNIPWGSNPHAICSDGTYIWTANYATTSVTRIPI